MIENVLTYVIPSAMALLPGSMDTPAARAEILAIGLQESGFKARFQIGGPARGFWQCEKNGGVKGVLTDQSSRTYAMIACAELCYSSEIASCYEAIAHNDVLACVFARLLLWTLPGMLAERGMPERGWRQYEDAWRPGKPHRETWNDHFARAWTLVAP